MILPGILVGIEILILIFCLFTRSEPKKIRSITHIGIFLVFTIGVFTSLIPWDYRWYGLGILLLLLALHGTWTLLTSKHRKGQFKARTIVVKATFVILLIFIVMIPGILFPRYERIATTGDYSTNTASFTLVDQIRDELFTADPDHRRVQVAFWYPQAKLENELFPLIIFSHGGLGTITSNESLYLELASHGYVVCSIGHPYHALWTKDENRSITLVNKEYFLELQKENPQKDKGQSFLYYQKWMKLRTEDINFILDTIINKADSRLHEMYERINGESIGVIGHSLGGSAVLAIPRIRNDIDMVIALESPFLFDIVGVENDEFLWLEQDFPVHVLNIYSDSAWENLSSWPQYGRNVEMIENSGDTIQNLYFPGAGHFSLTDLSLASPLLVGMLEGGKSEIEYRDYLQQVNQLVLEFADLHLKKDN